MIISMVQVINYKTYLEIGSGDNLHGSGNKLHSLNVKNHDIDEKLHGLNEKFISQMKNYIL